MIRPIDPKGFVSTLSTGGSRRRIVLGILTILLTASSPSYGQATAYARLVGTVKDQTGAVLRGVRITATAAATNVSRSTVSDGRGEYLIDKLVAGRYELKGELPGFKSQLTRERRLEVSRVVRVDLTLTPGEISQQITVTDRPTIIDTDTAEVASIIERKKILDMPLLERDLVKLAYLTTGE